MVAAKCTHIITLAVNIIYLYLNIKHQKLEGTGLRTNSAHPRQTMSACDTTAMNTSYYSW